MHYRVIEPHADDAFLSLGGHIKRWIADGHHVEIVTVYATQKRAAEAKAYADSVGAAYQWLGYIEAGSMDKAPEPIDYLPPMDGWVTICPLGLRHEEHYAVRKAYENGRGSTDVLWYYVDQPYAMQLKNQEDLSAKMAGKEVVSVFKPGGRKYHKNTVALFKTQSLFFYYNKDALPYTIEMIIS